jgi:hypothetical protein
MQARSPLVVSVALRDLDGKKASPPVDVVTPPDHVVLISHGAKMSLSRPLHLSPMFHPVASLLEPKMKH